ncbi:MAG: VWA domain-containing protein [Terracidiphilus sp.]|jgi:VWFA-related protein
MRSSPCACLALLACIPVLSWAQPTPAPVADPSQPPTAPASQAPAPATKNAEGRIHLDVVVTDPSGRPISGLDLNDFTLLDNNQPGKILSFHAIDGVVQKAHPPVEIILLIDTVNEWHQQVAFARQEIAKFLSQNGGHLAQPVSLFVFTRDGLDAQRLPSADGNALAVKVDQIDDTLRGVGARGGSWGAIELFQRSIKTMMDIADSEAKKPGRKLLIWVGPGWPLLTSPHIDVSYQGQQQSLDMIAKLSTKLREARIAAYSISAGNPVQGTYTYKDYLGGVKSVAKASPSDLGLKVLAVQSGGRVVGPDNDLTSQINNCVQDAGVFYTLSFDPPPAGHANEYHDLKVQIDKPGLTARTNTGYYNQP